MAGKTPDAGTFGGRFKIARLEAGLSAPAVAERLSYARAQSIYDIENGKSTPDPERAADAAALFSVPLLWLATGRDGAGDQSEHMAKLATVAGQLSMPRQRELATMAQSMLTQEQALRRQLRQLGQLDEETIEAILNAGPEPDAE